MPQLCSCHTSQIKAIVSTDVYVSCHEKLLRYGQSGNALCFCDLTLGLLLAAHLHICNTYAVQVNNGKVECTSQQLQLLLLRAGLT